MAKFDTTDPLPDIQTGNSTYWITWKGTPVLINRSRKHWRKRRYLWGPFAPPGYPYPWDQIQMAIKQLSRHWKNTLSAAQRTAWADMAATVQITNWHGNLVTTNGFGLFMHFHMYRFPNQGQRAGIFLLTTFLVTTTPPDPWVTPVAPIATQTDGQPLSVPIFTFTNVPVDATYRVIGTAFPLRQVGPPNPHLRQFSQIERPLFSVPPNFEAQIEHERVWSPVTGAAARYPFLLDFLVKLRYRRISNNIVGHPSWHFLTERPVF